MWQAIAPSRRLTSRVDVSEDVWVYWWCHGREEISRVKNLGIGGLFLETPLLRPAGIEAQIHFLIQEGLVRVEATVCHGVASRGVGLKFRSIGESDRRNLAALIMRLRGLRS